MLSPFRSSIPRTEISNTERGKKKSQNQWALFTNQVPALIRPPSILSLLVHPCLHYCARVWGSTYQSNLKRLITLQKRVVRIISRSAFDGHTNPIFMSLRMVKFDNIVKLQIGKLMYLYKNGLYPERFNGVFCRNCDKPYNTRTNFRFSWVCPAVGKM